MAVLNNHTYNLMKQIVQESKSLQRIKNNYIDESEADACTDYWKKLSKQKEDVIGGLVALLKEEINK